MLQFISEIGPVATALLASALVGGVLILVILSPFGALVLAHLDEVSERVFPTPIDVNPHHWHEFRSLFRDTVNRERRWHDGRREYRRVSYGDPGYVDDVW